jgi:hypothetical protein
MVMIIILTIRWFKIVGTVVRFSKALKEWFLWHTNDTENYVHDTQWHGMHADL